MMEEMDRFHVPPVNPETQPLDPTATATCEADTETRDGEGVAMNYKPSPLQVKIEKQRELARKGSVKNGTVGSPVNQQPKKNNVMSRTRLVVPNKGYSSLDQCPDEKPLVALDTDRFFSMVWEARVHKSLVHLVRDNLVIIIISHSLG
uniref:Family with sequence similarity 219 member Aa n=1 Tax=Denticeps clupeoides TaxID=299321 RepID=A0AAY4AHF6_9TELE